MTIQLSARSERVIPYEYFGEGKLVDLMPLLINAGYLPASVAVLVDRRQHAPEEVRANFNTYFWTGDSAATNENGEALLTLDSPLLRLLHPKSPLGNGALKLKREQWEELKADQEHSLYLKSEEVEAVNGEGYVLKNGKFVPANDAVAKVWNHLNRGKDLQNYAQMVSEASKSKEVMKFYFKGSQSSTPVLKSLLFYSYGYISTDEISNLDSIDGCLIGVSSEKVLDEARVMSALKVGRAFEFNGQVYAPVKGVSVLE